MAKSRRSAQTAVDPPPAAGWDDFGGLAGYERSPDEAWDQALDEEIERRMDD